MVFTGSHAVQDLAGGRFSVQGIVFMVLGPGIIAALLFVDWRILLQQKKLQFIFRFWK